MKIRPVGVELLHSGGRTDGRTDRDFTEILKISNFMKIRPVGTELFHAGVRTDGQTNGQRVTDRHDETHSRFSQFCQLA
jgi:hypothetical protein